MAAAEAEAKKNGWTFVIAVVDTRGLLVMLERMDDTQTASVQVAVEKARTAAMFKRPSKAFEDALAGGRMAILRMPGATPIEGGVPLVKGGRIIGAIGVSGMTSPAGRPGRTGRSGRHRKVRESGAKGSRLPPGRGRCVMERFSTHD